MLALTLSLALTVAAPAPLAKRNAPAPTLEAADLHGVWSTNFTTTMQDRNYTLELHTDKTFIDSTGNFGSWYIDARHDSPSLNGPWIVKLDTHNPEHSDLCFTCAHKPTDSLHVYFDQLPRCYTDDNPCNFTSTAVTFLLTRKLKRKPFIPKYLPLN